MGATKRKAPMEELGRDRRQDWCLRLDDAEKAYRRGTSGAGVQANGGGMMRISEEEGTRIMMEARAMKTIARRVTTSGGETQDKRMRRAAATSDDGECFLVFSPHMHAGLMLARDQKQTHAFRGDGKLKGCHRRLHHQVHLKTQRALVSTLLRVV